MTLQTILTIAAAWLGINIAFELLCVRRANLRERGK